jgi:lysozyme family protein
VVEAVTPLDALVGRVIQREGGVADVGDGKGVTRYGQTPDWLAQFNLPTPKTPEDAAANYLTWIALLGFHPLVDAGDNLADILLDIAVMSSGAKAVKALQTALGINADGVLGPQTLEALSRAASREVLATLVIAWDMEYQGSVITLNPQRAQYAKGWARRMAEHVRRLV